MVARLFVASILPWDDYIVKSGRNHEKRPATLEHQPSLNNTLLVTTDADLWPLSPNMYHFPRGKETFNVKPVADPGFLIGGRRPRRGGANS